MRDLDNQLDESQEAQGETAEVPESDEQLLKQIREDYRYCRDYWDEIRAEAAIDMQYMVGDIWTSDEKEERKDRPCIVPDELSQYTKQANNNLRQNKRAIKVTPKGSGATDEDAGRRESIIRGIEHASSAQAARTTAFESCVECGMGFYRVTTEYISESGEVQPRIRRIPNPFTVLMDPNAKEADFSDMSICFVTDVLRKSEFARKYPRARKRSFTVDDQNLAPEWFDGENIVVAEYFERKSMNPTQKMPTFKVTQYITNGLEILETNPWDGSWIPVISVMGEEKYVKQGNKSKRHFLSLIRRARGPQKMLAFVASQEAEEFSMAPRAPMVGFVGTFATDKEAWDYAHKIPRAYLQVDVPEGWQPGWGVPPLPTRPQFQPNPQAYEMAFERWRRSVQAAMGITPLPTAAQRQNEKSGVALERIQTQQAVGAFHFTDNYDRSLANEGRQINELITLVMDTPRQVEVRAQDETHALLHVTTKAGLLKGLPPDVKNDDYLVVDRGEFSVSISTGPNHESQRDAANDFVDTLVQYIGKLPIPPPLQMHILGLAIKLKNIGPIGQEIAELLLPPDKDNIPPQAQAAIAQAQGMIQQLQGELQKLTQEKEGKVIENEYRLKIVRLQEQAGIAGKILDNEVKIAVAEIQTKAQKELQRDKLESDLDTKLHVTAHDRASQVAEQAHEKLVTAAQHLHEKDVAESQAANQSAQSAQDAAQQAELAQQAQQTSDTSQE